MTETEQVTPTEGQVIQSNDTAGDNREELESTKA